MSGEIPMLALKEAVEQGLYQLTSWESPGSHMGFVEYTPRPEWRYNSNRRWNPNEHSARVKVITHAEWLLRVKERIERGGGRVAKIIHDGKDTALFVNCVREDCSHSLKEHVSEHLEGQLGESALNGSI